ncbi:uncharacterized protein LOC141905225 [Tubulanus polymorphus]|uniref:uncharacterized protein LOC141905225 n=1 Tax=Tubulanus polymorphus TaxID=672921 RepID=UPI003DA657AE
MKHHECTCNLWRKLEIHNLNTEGLPEPPNEDQKLKDNTPDEQNLSEDNSSDNCSSDNLLSVNGLLEPPNEDQKLKDNTPDEQNLSEDNSSTKTKPNYTKEISDFLAESDNDFAMPCNSTGISPPSPPELNESIIVEKIAAIISDGEIPF